MDPLPSLPADVLEQTVLSAGDFSEIIALYNNSSQVRRLLDYPTLIVDPHISEFVNDVHCQLLPTHIKRLEFTTCVTAVNFRQVTPSLSALIT